MAAPSARSVARPLTPPGRALPRPTIAGRWPRASAGGDASRIPHVWPSFSHPARPGRRRRSSSPAGSAPPGRSTSTTPRPSLSSLKPVQKGRSSAIYAADGSLIGFIRSDNIRQPVRGTALPQTLKEATVAIEDKNFYKHGALDHEGIARAALEGRCSRGGKPVQGASTITQQLVRNLYIQPPRRHDRAQDQAKRASPPNSRTSTTRIGSSPPTSTPPPTGRSKGRPRSAPRRRRRPTSANRRKTST